jgi:transposase
MKLTKQRAFPTIPNKNICVPIGSILAVQYFYEKLNFCDIFGKHKSKGLDLNSLLIGLLSYKLTENFSIKEAGKWSSSFGLKKKGNSQYQLVDTVKLRMRHRKITSFFPESLPTGFEYFLLSKILDRLLTSKLKGTK